MAKARFFQPDACLDFMHTCNEADRGKDIWPASWPISLHYTYSLSRNLASGKAGWLNGLRFGGFRRPLAWVNLS